MNRLVDASRKEDSEMPSTRGREVVEVRSLAPVGIRNPKRVYDVVVGVWSSKPRAAAQEKDRVRKRAPSRPLESTRGGGGYKEVDDGGSDGCRAATRGIDACEGAEAIAELGGEPPLVGLIVGRQEDASRGSSSVELPVELSLHKCVKVCIRGRGRFAKEGLEVRPSHMKGCEAWATVLDALSNRLPKLFAWFQLLEHTPLNVRSLVRMVRVPCLVRDAW